MNAEHEVLGDLVTYMRKMALSKNPQIRISAACWELFFQLPLTKLVALRNEALREGTDFEVISLPMAASAQEGEAKNER